MRGRGPARHMEASTFGGSRWSGCGDGAVYCRLAHDRNFALEGGGGYDAGYMRYIDAFIILTRRVNGLGYADCLLIGLYGSYQRDVTPVIGVSRGCGGGGRGALPGSCQGADRHVLMLVELGRGESMQSKEMRIGEVVVADRGMRGECARQRDESQASQAPVIGEMRLLGELEK